LFRVSVKIFTIYAASNSFVFKKRSFISTEGFNRLAFAGNFAMSDRNIVYIGNKPIMNYCLAVLSSLQGDGSTVHLKARGRAISSAVDVAEVTRNRFLNDLSVDSIEIGTEELENTEGQKRNVSTITITLKKG